MLGMSPVLWIPIAVLVYAFIAVAVGMYYHEWRARLERSGSSTKFLTDRQSAVLGVGLFWPLIFIVKPAKFIGEVVYDFFNPY